MGNFIGTGIIMLLATMFYIVAFPCEYWYSITFRNYDGITGYFVSIGTVVFLVGSALAMVHITKLLVD